MIRAVRRSIARKLLVAVGVPSALFAALGVAWLWHETRHLAPGLERVAIVAVLLFGAAVTAVHFVAVRLVVERPLQRLAFGMRRARDGDFLHRVRTGGVDELAGLADEFNGTLAAITDLKVGRIEDAASMESMQRELALKTELEAQHRLLDDANRRLEGRVRELTLLSELSRALGSTLELDALLGAIGERVGRMPGFEAFEILLPEPSGELAVRAASAAGRAALGRATHRGEGPAGRAAAERRVVLARGAPGSDGSILAVPMLHQGEVGGVLAVSRPGADAFLEDEVRLLQAVAAQAAMAVANARLHAETVRLSRTPARPTAAASSPGWSWSWSAASASGSRSPSRSSTWTGSVATTARAGAPRATRSSGAWGSSSSPACGGSTWWRATRARSSRWSCRTPTTRWRSRPASSCGARWRTPRSTTARAGACPSRWGSLPGRRTGAISPPSSTAPTPRSTPPSGPGATPSGRTRRACASTRVASATCG